MPSFPESNVLKNRVGKDPSLLKHTWKAQWITHPTESTLDYGVFHFRNTFKLNSKPSQFFIHISADNKYRLYVNGTYVGFGPATSDLSHQNYETINISKYLITGKNIIAVEVVNFGEHKKASQISYQTAFLLQGEEKNEANINTGSSTWKVIKNYGYSAIPFTSEILKSYYAAGPCDKMDAAKYPWGWNKANYDDSKWLKPKNAATEFATGRGFLYGGAWFLEPRTIPMMEEIKEPFTKIARTSNLKVENAFLKGNTPLKVPANSKISILIDHTHHTTGFPELTYSKGNNSHIKITYAEALTINTDSSKKISDGNLLMMDIRGNRNEIEGKSIFGYYDIILPDGGCNRFFKPLSRRTYRFIKLEIKTQKEELIIEKYHGVYTGYPFKEIAKFKSKDSLLQKIWSTSWRTLRNSSEECFVDPYYEQLQYIGDTRIESLVSIYVSGDDRLMRKAIKQFDDSRTSEGLTQSRYPSSIVQIIPPFSLLWIDMIHDYFMYRNNPEFLRQFLPGIQSVLYWFISRIANNGMVTNLSWWNFTDWTLDYPNGIPSGADDGYSANISMQLVKSLQHASNLFSYFKLEQEAIKYKQQANQLTKSVVKLCFDKQKGLLAETPSKKLFSQHTNTFAIISNSFDKEKSFKIMQKILDDKSLIQSTIYFKFYIFRALQKVGLGNQYLSMLAPWKIMIENGMTTFGETDINPRSECHAWSASPNFDFLHTIAGIYPGAHSFSSVIIEPNLGYLNTLDVEMPHPKGLIKASFTKKNQSITANITLPLSIKGIFKWNGKSIVLNEGTQKVSI